MTILWGRSTLIAAILLLGGLVGCKEQSNNPQEVREKTAEATAEIKSDAKAVADGVRDGWNRDRPLDLNSATRDQILSLPGVTGPEATRIVDNRPYRDPKDLVTRGVLSEDAYDKISDRVVAKK